MKMILKDGKLKVLTLSYDDGVVQDKRLIEIMNKHGLKGTFNICTNLYFPEDGVREKPNDKYPHPKLKLSEAKELYLSSGQELAIHSYHHPFLHKLKSVEIISEIADDRKFIEENYGRIVRGMAYPFGTYNDEVVDILDKCGIVYSRTTRDTNRFDFPENWLTLHPTCHHNSEKLMDLAKRFVESTNPWMLSQMFYLWGHSYEFDDNNNWEVIERFAEYIGGHDHIWYATNIEIYDYVQAYNRLETSFDQKIIHNPSAIDVWFESGKQIYCVKAGETIRI